MRWREGIGVFILAFSFQVFHFGSFYPLHCMLVNGILKKNICSLLRLDMKVLIPSISGELKRRVDMGKMQIDDTEISVISISKEDYISLTDMVRKLENGLSLIEKWLRNKNTLEFLGIWEEMYNSEFNTAEYHMIMGEAGLNRFVMSVKQWVNRTNSKGIVAKAGRYGGTYAHRDIAFEFASWVSPQFKLYLVKEFQRLKEQEQRQLGWSAKRKNINAVLIHDGYEQKERLIKLNRIAIQQMTILEEQNAGKRLE